MAPTTRAATAGPGARYTRDRASGISESENANDSRRKMNRKMLSSAPMKPMTITGSNQVGEGTTASPEFELVSNSAAPTIAKSTASAVTRRSGCDGPDAEMGTQGAPISLVSILVVVVTEHSQRGSANWTVPNVYRPQTRGP